MHGSSQMALVLITQMITQMLTTQWHSERITPCHITQSAQCEHGSCAHLHTHICAQTTQWYGVALALNPIDLGR